MTIHLNFKLFLAAEGCLCMQLNISASSSMLLVNGKEAYIKIKPFQRIGCFGVAAC